MHKLMPLIPIYKIIRTNLQKSQVLNVLVEAGVMIQGKLFPPNKSPSTRTLDKFDGSEGHGLLPLASGTAGRVLGFHVL